MKRVLAVIDLEPAARGGHFREWSSIITRGASRFVDCVCVYVSGFDSVPLETADIPYDPQASGDIALFDLETVLPSYLQSAPNASKVDYIIAHSVDFSGCDNAAAFVLWTFDLSVQKRQPAARWGGIGVLSAWARNVPSDSNELEAELFEFARDGQNCRALLVWDKFVLAMPPISKTTCRNEKKSKIHYLPDMEDVLISKQNYLPRSGTLKIGLVGMLWGYRGINLLASILEVNKDLDGYVAGQLKHESYNHLALHYLESRRISLGQTDGWMSNSAFNEEISQLDALVIDAQSYPPPSGVALRSLALGRCIIASAGSSWTNDVIRHYDCGLIVDPLRLEGLSDRTRSFYEAGGSEKCLRAANDLLNKVEFENCLGHAIDALFD